MSRIETFVDAAFAFAFTMLVISIDDIPDSPQELLLAARDIPAFILSATIIGSIWLAHATWSRTFGLQDSLTIYLSLGLVMLVLIFVYPIKLMIQISVTYLSQGYLGTQPPEMAYEDVASLFVFFALGLIALSALIISLYQNSLRHQQQLLLNEFEIFFCQRTRLLWLVVALTALLSLVLAIILPRERISGAGFIYSLLWVALPLTRYLHKRAREKG